MVSRYFVFFTLLFTCCLLYSQDYGLNIPDKDTIPGAYDRKYGNSEKVSSNSVFFSFTTGYSKIISDDSFKGYWIKDASLGLIIKNRWVLGLTFEFWKSSYKGYYAPGLYRDIEYSGSGSNVNFGYKAFMLKNKLSIYGGMGFGKYNINSADYSALSLLTCFSYYPANFISIDCKGSYYCIFSFHEFSRFKNTLNAKLGVSFYIHY